MKLALFNDHRPGLVMDDRIVDISEIVGDAVMAQKAAQRMNAIIDGYARLRPLIAAAQGAGIPLDEVRLRAPLPQPGKMLFGQGNYNENVVRDPWPIGMFLKPPSSVLDPDGVVALPAVDAVVFHHEAELGVVIGRRASNVAGDIGLDYVFGYTCVFDVSARGMGSGVGLTDKGFDTFCPMGPWITTADEIPDPQKLSIRCWENGQIRQDYNTDDMENPVRELVAWASRVVTLEPGDLIACGTNHQGIGPMQDGETATIEIEKIGRMSVSVHDPLNRKWPMDVDRGIGRSVRDWKLGGRAPDPKTDFVKRIA